LFASTFDVVGANGGAEGGEEEGDGDSEGMGWVLRLSLGLLFTGIVMLSVNVWNDGKYVNVHCGEFFSSVHCDEPNTIGLFMDPVICAKSPPDGLVVRQAGRSLNFGTRNIENDSKIVQCIISRANESAICTGEWTADSTSTTTVCLC
jgi:hypothetical protein